MNPQQINNLMKLLRDMRREQKIFFATRSGNAMKKAIALEAKLDKCIKGWEAQQASSTPASPKLFN
jgi:hypothetical protein